MKSKAPEKKEGNLRQTNERLIGTLESMTDGFVSLDRNWRYVYVNKRAAEMLGRKQEDLVGKHIWTEFPEGVANRSITTITGLWKIRSRSRWKSTTSRGDRWFENRIYPTVEGLSIFFQDVTERKRAEDLSNGKSACTR